MKLYIPTCTMNFNNILSTESISPKVGYSKRMFGNRRYYSVESNDNDNVIILYSKYPYFKVDNTDIENYPMVIEIETDDYINTQIVLSTSVQGVDIYTCANTIYLNPFHSVFYFESVSVLQGVIVKAEQSLENKFSNLYSVNMRIRKPQTKRVLEKTEDLFFNEMQDCFQWSAMYAPYPKTSEESFRNDAYIDRVKGFLYCFLIGANTSVSQDIASLKATARVLRNTLSAIVNSPDHRPTKQQDELMVDKIKYFNTIFQKKDSDVIKNRKLVSDALVNNPLNLSEKDCLLILKYCKVYDTFCDRLHLQPTYDANDLWRAVEFSTQEVYGEVVSNLYDAVSNVENNELRNREKVKLTNLLQVDGDKEVRLVDPSFNHEFYEKLVNSQLKSEYKKVIESTGADESLAIAFNGGNILKDIMGKQWKNSSISSYVNALLAHFQESSYFDLFKINKDVPISFAAFCQKNESIDGLKNYLVQNGIGNYKLAFGLYGATRGFASLPKTFTSELIDGDKQYFSEVWLSIYKCLFGVELKNIAFQTEPSLLEVSHIGSINEQIVNNIDAIEPKHSKQGVILNAVQNAANLEYAVQSPKAFMYIADDILGRRSNAYKALKAARFAEDDKAYKPREFRSKILSIIGAKLPKGKQGEETIAKIDKIIELEAKRQDPEAFLYILNDFLKPSSSAYKKIVAMLNNRSNRTNVSSSFNDKKDIALNDNVIPKLRHMQIFSDERVAKKLEQNWQYTKDKYPHDIKEHIRFFVNLCSKEGRGESKIPSPLKDIFTKEIAKKLEQELKKLYGVE